MLPAIGKVAGEDEMPGRSLALVEEIVLCLTTYGTTQEKAQALLGVISDVVVEPLVRDVEVGRCIMAVDLLRITALIQSRPDQQSPAGLVSPLV